MAERNAENFGDELMASNKHIAVMSLDVLVDSRMLKQEDFDLAVDLVAEEMFARLSGGEYPPQPPDVPIQST